MYLTRHETSEGARWALDGRFLPAGVNLSLLLSLPRQSLADVVRALPVEEPAEGRLLPPLDSMHEVWASGVTYLRSRDARKAESEMADVYDRVYDAARPELFFKAIGHRVTGHEDTIRIRADSTWNVPEPELALVVNREGDIVGYCAGDDVSSRSIEGENPLYLPQAKMYDGSCALGPGIVLAGPDDVRDIPVQLSVLRDEAPVFEGETRTGQMKRSAEELVAYLYREMSFVHGAFLLTGTGIVPPDSFTLQPGDIVQVNVGTLQLVNTVEAARS